MITLKISSDDLTRAISALKAVRTELENRRPPLKIIKEKQIDRWAVNFDSQGSIYGNWPAASETTARIKERMGAGSTLLVRTGKMRSNFLAINKRGKVTREAVHWNINSVPLVYHDSGSRNVLFKTRNPQRLIYNMNEVDSKRAQRELERWIKVVFEKHLG